MEDHKKDKTKRSHTDHVKNIVHNYLQKRNYASIALLENSTIEQQITYSLVENAVSRPNSILYSSYNSDSAVIDQNFTKFVWFVKDLVKKSVCTEIEFLIAPLFCHLYLDILKGGHSERAAAFLKAHLQDIDKTKCDDFVKDLINLFTNNCDATCMIEQFRGNKYFLELNEQTLTTLKKFVSDNCHVVFLHALQTWFDLQPVEEKLSEAEEMDEKLTTNGVGSDRKLQKLLDVFHDLEKEPQQIFISHISNTNDTSTTAVINRNCGVIAYNQNNVVHLRSIHAFDPIFGITDCKEIKLIEHSKRIYSITISPDCNYLVTGAEDSSVCIFALNEMKLIKNCSGHLAPVYCTAISSNNVYVSSGSQDTTAQLWNLESGDNLRVFIGHSQAITCIDFHPNCLYVVTGSSDRNVRLWSVDNGGPLRLFHGCKGVVYSVKFNPLGDTLVTTSDDKKIKVWDILSCKVIIEFKYKGEPMTKTVWSRDGKQLACGSIDSIVRIWNFDLNANDKNQEPCISITVNGKILGLEYCFDTFACVTT